MSSLLIDEPPPAAPAPPGVEAPVAPASRSCPACAAPLAAGQNWCLECGNAAPGRLGVRSGWRLAALVVGITLLMASGALAASYSALSSDSRKAVTTTPTLQASTPPPATAATPATAPPPATVTPTTPAVPVKPPATPTPPVATPVTPPAAAATPAPATPKVTAPTTKTPTKTPTTPAPSSSTNPAPHQIVLDTDAASTYNPNSYPDSRFGDPANAIDGDATTAWTATLDPSGNCKLAAGLDLNLKAPQALRSLSVVTDTPGMDVEVYAAQTSAEPVSILDPGWIHLASRKTIRRNAKIKLNTGSKRYRRLLLWIPHGPQGKCTAPVSLNELAVQG